MILDEALGYAIRTSSSHPTHSVDTPPNSMQAPPLAPAWDLAHPLYPQDKLVRVYLWEPSSAMAHKPRGSNPFQQSLPVN